MSKDNKTDHEFKMYLPKAPSDLLLLMGLVIPMTYIGFVLTSDSAYQALRNGERQRSVKLF